MVDGGYVKRCPGYRVYFGQDGQTLLILLTGGAVGFEKLGAATATPPKSLIRMFGPRGNPQARSLFSVIGYLQKRAGVRLRVAA